MAKKKIKEINLDTIIILVNYSDNGKWSFKICQGLKMAHRFYSYMIRHGFLNVNYTYLDGEKPVIVKSESIKI